MSSLKPFTETLAGGNNLSREDAEKAAHLLTESSLSVQERKDFLLALQEKGETVEEVVAFAEVFRSLARNPGLDEIAPHSIDIVGTGGSGTGGYNISSVSALILAASGIKVLKHGNRAVTSKSGTADFLTQLGIYIQNDPDTLRNSMEALNFCFFFAPAFHPAFKEIIPVRKELAAEGKRTIFNILGPLINPAKPAYQLLGVHSEHWVKPLADALTQLKLQGGFAVHCTLRNGKPMDELTTAGINRICGIGRNADVDTTWDPLEFGFPPTPPEELAGGTPEENTFILEDILQGNGRSGLVDTIALNAGSAFYIMNQVESVEAGCAKAREVMLGGELAEWLVRAKEFYAPLKPEA